MNNFDEWWNKEGRDLYQRADIWLVAKAAWDAAIKNAAPQDDCHTSDRAQGQRPGKSLDQREAGLPAGAAPEEVIEADLAFDDELDFDDGECLQEKS